MSQDKSLSSINITIQKDSKNSLVEESAIISNSITQRKPSISPIKTVNDFNEILPDTELIVNNEMKIDILEEEQDTNTLLDQTLNEIDFDEKSDKQKIDEIIESSVLKNQKETQEIEEILNGTNQQPAIHEEIVSDQQDTLRKTIRPLREDENAIFEEGETAKFVNRIDMEGIEYLTLEINLAMINPKDFGFEKYTQKDELKLQEKLQAHFMEELMKDKNLKDQGINVLDLI